MAHTTVQWGVKMSDVPKKHVDDLTREDIAGIVDDTYLLRPESYPKADVDPATQHLTTIHRFLGHVAKRDVMPYMICVRPEEARRVAAFFMDNPDAPGIAAVAGFPDPEWYVASMTMREIDTAQQGGADEIDFVLPWRNLTERHPYAQEYVTQVAAHIRDIGLTSKLILESGALSVDDLHTAIKIAQYAGVDMIKTSTGFGPGGAERGSLTLMARYGAVKISGGVNEGNYRELLTALADHDQMIQVDPTKVRIGVGYKPGKGSLLDNI